MRNQKSSAGVSPREVPDVSKCQAIYSHFLQEVLCVTAKPKRCQHAVTVNDQTCCHHPAAVDIVIATVKKATRKLSKPGRAS